MYVCLVYVCIFEAYIHTRSNIHAQTYKLEAFKHTRLRASNIRLRALNIHTRSRDSNIHTCTLEGSILNRPLEAQKIKFRAGSPECFKTLTETKVWTYFLVQAGYLSFGLQKPPMTKSILTLLSMYVRFRLYYVNATGENWVCMYVY